MYKRGEIVLIPVPFSDLSASKKRPVLVVSNDNHNTSGFDIVVVAITSNLIQQGISLNNSDMSKGQLPKPSVIRCDKIYSLDKSIVIKSIGNVSNVIMNTVKAEIISLIS
jgi:mRNA interferase MazF